MTEANIREHIDDLHSDELTQAVWEVAAQLAAMNEARAQADERNAALDEEDSRKRDENNRKLIALTQELGGRLDRLGAPLMPPIILPEREQ